MKLAEQPQAAPVASTPELTGGDVVRGIIRAMNDRDANPDPAVKQRAGAAIVEGATLLKNAMFSGGDSPDAFNLRAGAAEIVRALDFDAWHEGTRPQIRAMRSQLDEISGMLGGPAQEDPFGSSKVATALSEGINAYSQEAQQRSAGLDLFRKRSAEDAPDAPGKLVDDYTTERGWLGGTGGKLFVRPELAKWRVRFDDPDAQYREAIATAPLGEGRTIDTVRGPQAIPELDELAKTSIKEALLNVDHWSSFPAPLQHAVQNMGVAYNAALALERAMTPDGGDVESNYLNVQTAQPGLVMPFVPNLSGNDDSGTAVQNRALSLARLRDPAWARAVHDEVQAQIQGGLKPSMLDHALGASGMVVDFIATMGAMKAAGAVGLDTAVAAGGPRVKLAAQTAKAFGNVANASRAGGGFLPTGLTGTAEMVAYENLKAAITGESQGEATTRGILLGAGSSIAHVVARPITKALGIAMSRLPGPAGQAFADALRARGDWPQEYIRRLQTLPSASTTIRELVETTTRNKRWAAQTMHWMDSYMVGAQFGAWEAAHAEAGDQWDSMNLGAKATAAAGKLGSREAVGMGLGIAAAGMLYAGATHSKANPAYAKMTAEERAAVDRMTDHLRGMMTGPQASLADWGAAVEFFDRYRAAHPTEFTEKQRPTAPPPAGHENQQLSQAESLKAKRYAENEQRRAAFKAQAPTEFDAAGEPTSTRAAEFWERNPIESRGTARAEEVRRRFVPSAATAVVGPDGPSYTFTHDLTGNAEFYAMPKGPFAVRRAQMTGEVDARGPQFRSQGWVIVHGEGSGEKFGERVQNTGAYENRDDAMSVASAIAIRNRVAPRYATKRGQNLPGDEPPPPPSPQGDLPLGGDGPRPPGPVAPSTPGGLAPGAPAARGQQQWTVTTEEAQAAVDAHYRDPDKAGMSPVEIVEEVLRQGGREALTPEKLREHELRVEPPAPIGTPEGTTAAVSEQRAGRVPPPHPDTTPTPAEGAKVDRPQSVRAGSIEVDPARFQFKADTTGTEGVRELDIAEGGYDPRKAGIVTVWQDKDGTFWIVNGHHRLARAKRAGADTTMLAWILRESDGITDVQARTIGAIDNLADGKGTALDAAKVMRDNGWTAADLVANGVNTKAGMAKQATGIAALANEVFSRVVNGEIPENYAAIIGRELAGQPGKQAEAVQLAKELANEAEVAAAVRNIKNSADITTTTMDMFGGETSTRSLAAERAKVEVAIERKLKSEKGLFNTLAKKAGLAERVKGNVVDKDASASEAQRQADLLDTMSKLGGSKGPVSDALNEAAAQLARGEPIAAVTDAAIKRLAEVDWKAGSKAKADEPRSLPSPAGDRSAKGVLPREVKNPREAAVERRAQAEASAEKVYNILRDAGVLDTGSAEHMRDFSRVLDSLVRGDDTVLVAMQIGGMTAEQASRAYADAQAAARATRTYLQQTAYELAVGDAPARAMLDAYFQALQDHADTRSISPETMKALKDAGLADKNGALNREATKLLGEWVDLKMSTNAARAERKALDAQLPKDLAGAKPRYGYKSDNFELAFESDVDRALYIVGQEKKSARDADYRAFLKSTGMTDEQMDREAPLVRSAVKALAKDAASQPEVPKTLKLPKRPRGGAQSGGITNPALAFTALARGLWQTFGQVDAAQNLEAATRMARMKVTLARLNPVSRTSMDRSFANNELFVPKSLLGLVRFYNRFGGQWSNTLLPTQIRDMQRDIINDVFRQNNAQAANEMFEVEDLFAKHLTFDGQRVGTTDLKFLYDAIDSGLFRTLKDESQWAQHAGEQRRYLFPFMVELTRLSNAILDRGVELGRFDPRQADKMRSRWIPHDYLTQNRDLNYKSLVSGSMAPVVDRHSLSRTASSQDQATLTHMDPYYLWQRGLRRESRTNTFLQTLKDMQVKGYSIPYDTFVSDTYGPAAKGYQRPFFETAALAKSSGSIERLDPVHGRRVEGRQARFAMVLQNIREEMQTAESAARGEMPPPGKRAYSEPLDALLKHYLGPEYGIPDANGVVKPGAVISEGIGRELDWTVDALLPQAEANTFQHAYGLGLRAWRQNVTVHSYPHWITNQVSNAFLNWGTGRLPITDYVSSILWGRGYFADAMKDAYNWQTYMAAGKPTVRPQEMSQEEFDSALRFERTANQLHGGLFVNTVVKRGGLQTLIGAGIEPDAITADLRAQLAQKRGVTQWQRLELESAIDDWGRRLSSAQGGFEKSVLDHLGSRSSSNKIAATQALHGQYGIWELVHKHGATLAQMERSPNMTHEAAAIWAAAGTVDYGDTSPLIRNGYNDPSARRSEAYYATESKARAKQLGRYLLANPFALFMAGGVPRWVAGMHENPVRSAAVLAAGAAINAGLWAAFAAAGGDPREKMLALSGSRGNEGLPLYSPTEADMAAEGAGYQPTGAENLPQQLLTKQFAAFLMHTAGTAPAPGGMISDVGKMVPQLDLVSSVMHTAQNMGAKSVRDNVVDTADAILGLNVGMQQGILAGLFDVSRSPDRSVELQKQAVQVLRRTMPQTGDMWWASRGGQDAIGSAMGASLPDLLTAMPVPNKAAGERAAQATWRFFWNARQLRPYAGWKDTRDLGAALLEITGVQGGSAVNTSNPERVQAGRLLGQWAPKAVAAVYSNFRAGKYAEPATLDSMLAWQFGLAHDLRTDVPDLVLVDEPQTPIGKWIKGQGGSPAVQSELVHMAFDYVHGPAFGRAVAPILEIGRGRAFDPMLVEEAFRSSAKDQSGAGLLKMTLALAETQPDKLGQAWMIFRNLPPPDPRSAAGADYAKLKALFREGDRGILEITPLPNMLDTFGGQAFQGGLPAVQTINAQERLR